MYLVSFGLVFSSDYSYSDAGADYPYDEPYEYYEEEEEYASVVAADSISPTAAAGAGVGSVLQSLPVSVREDISVMVHGIHSLFEDLTADEVLCLLQQHNFDVQKVIEYQSEKEEPATLKTSPTASFECPICLSTEESSMQSKTCAEHSCCSECFTGYLTNAVNEGSVEITCPCRSNKDSKSKCASRIGLSQLRESLSNEMFQKCVNLYESEFVQKCVDRKFCANPRSCGAILTLCSRDDILKCSACRFSNCCRKYCSLESHTSFVSCAEAKQWCVSIEEVEELNTVECPKCAVLLVKDAGCDHMQCSSCKYKFCWICLNADHTYFEKQCVPAPSRAAKVGDKTQVQLDLATRSNHYADYMVTVQARIKMIQTRADTLQKTFSVYNENIRELVAALEEVYAAYSTMKWFCCMIAGGKGSKDRLDYVERQLEQSISKIEGNVMSILEIEELKRQVSETVTARDVFDLYMQRIRDGALVLKVLREDAEKSSTAAKTSV